MKSRIAVALCCLCAGISANAQCPGTPLTLSTQSQVDNFPSNYPGCTELNVSLTIQGNNITNLDGLSVLTSITKSLFIKNCPALASVTGLSNLSNIGVELTFDNCDALVSFNGLQSLPFIGGSLTITGNAILSNISALNNLNHINGSLLVSFCPLVTDLSGLGNVTFTGRFLQINNNNGLTSLNGLNSLTEVGNNASTIGRYLSITSNPNLVTLNGLHNLESVGKEFEITNNSNLASLNAFENLATVGDIFAITGNPVLTSVLDFASLSSVTGTLTISNNNILSDCEALGICDFLEGSGTAIISNNDPGCNSVAEVEAECLLLPVQLTSFEGKRAPNGVLLDWQTASEKNNAFFEVEHFVKGAQGFQTIGQVPGKGTTSGVGNYHFYHRQPPEGINYYRLKQVDFDGKFEYSNIVSVVLDGAEKSVDVFPNPTAGQVWVKGSEQAVTASVTDLAGRTILEQNLSESSLIDLAGQPKGIYFIAIQTDSGMMVKRVAKE